MKFQILTYQRVKNTTKVVDPFEAMAIGLPFEVVKQGDTPEEARNKVIKAAQVYLDHYTNLTVTEVEVAPANVDVRGKPL